MAELKKMLQMKSN